jgi:protein-L-isoaspartate(D-aspartate) O-methyltransferase
MDIHALYEFYRRLDRAYFIQGEGKALACLDSALPIGPGQPISQPSLVLEMTARLSPGKDSKVLEIGTGSGYQTALLAEFSGAVYTIERIPELAEKAKESLMALGYANIVYRVGDGSSGWPEEAQFDRIITTAAAGKLPEALVEQLKPGGRMIAPTGPQGVQDLMLIEKDASGGIATKSLGKVAFVEMVGKYGWNDSE